MSLCKTFTDWYQIEKTEKPANNKCYQTTSTVKLIIIVGCNTQAQKKLYNPSPLENNRT